MKTQRFTARPGRSLEDILEEYLMSGYDAELDGDEVVVYYGRQQRKSKHPREQSERWSKRERNFGYTRG